MVSVLLFFLLTTLCQGLAQVIRLNSSHELYAKLQSGEIDALVDVRRRDEWELGHIAGAYFVESLGSYTAAVADASPTNRTMNTSAVSSSSSGGGSPDDLRGCEYCTLALYCASGVRAQSAIAVLSQYGFEGILYNGLGVVNWVQAGYPLVNDTSNSSPPPPCTTNETVSNQCQQEWKQQQQNTVKQGNHQNSAAIPAPLALLWLRPSGTTVICITFWAISTTMMFL
ncbi:hypothetical protein ACA910_012539 [Epithemia clementina (nom. ined.)]